MQDDRAQVLALVDAAFTDAESITNPRDGHEEVEVVEATWARDAAVDGLELVAVDGDVVIGHVLGAWGDLDGRAIVGIAPLAVLPARQGEGIGIALMTEVLRRADAAGLPFVVLLGNPAYYGRFGFEPSGPLGITYAPVGADNPHFMVRKLSAYDPAPSGVFIYCWEIDAS